MESVRTKMMGWLTFLKKKRFLVNQSWKAISFAMKTVKKVNIAKENLIQMEILESIQGKIL
jgi:hypothetical protein